MNGRGWVVGLVAAAGLVAGGCGGEPKLDLAKVHGKVTYKGAPVTTGSVLFIPAKGLENGPAHPASGDIKPDGSYELTTDKPGDGAVVGEHKVTVMAFEVQKGDPRSKKPLVPPAYTDPDSTPLTKNVAAGDNTIDIEVKD